MQESYMEDPTVTGFVASEHAGSVRLFSEDYRENGESGATPISGDFTTYFHGGGE